MTATTKSAAKDAARRALADRVRAYARERDSRVLRFLDDAGLLDGEFRRPWFTPELLEQLAGRQRLYTGLNPGGLDVPVGQLLDAIRAHAWLRPVRSGHLGNWGPIWSGRAPLLAYNRAAVLDLGVARPVIHSVGLTETAALDGGDTLYRPGSIYRDGALTQIELATRADHTHPDAAGADTVGADDSNTRWRELDRRSPRFVPWTWGRVDGAWTPLVAHHVNILRREAPVPVLVDGALIWDHADTVRGWLSQLFEYAVVQAEDGDISWLFGRGVRRDATVGDLSVRFDGAAFMQSGDGGATWEFVGTAEQLADRCLLPYRVIAQPDEAEALVDDAPPVTPLLSNRLARTITAYLGVCEREPTGRPTSSEPFALFVEWGALSQGGYPPIRQGYFGGKGNQQMTRLTVAALAEANDLPALLYLMLPLTPAILMPSTAYPEDAEHLASFFTALREATDGLGDDTKAGTVRAAQALTGWHAADRVSEFYREKFSGRRSVVPFGPPGSADAASLETESVRALTLRQASLAVATLFDAWKPAL